MTTNGGSCGVSRLPYENAEAGPAKENLRLSVRTEGILLYEKIFVIMEKNTLIMNAERVKMEVHVVRCAVLLENGG